MFKNLSLQARIISAFVFMAALILVVALIGWHGNNRLNEHIAILGKAILPSTNYLQTVNEAQTAVQETQQTLANLSLGQAERQRAKKRMEEKFQNIDTSFAAYERLIADPSEQKIYAALKISWRKWVEDSRRYLTFAEDFDRLEAFNPSNIAIDLLQQGKGNTPEFAKTKQAIEIAKRQSEFANTSLMQSFKSSEADLLELLKYNAERGDTAVRNAEKDGNDFVRSSLGAAIAGAAFAIFFGIVFSNTIAKPLGAKIAGVVTVAEKISMGDLTSKLAEAEVKDEIGKLQDAFRSMTLNLNQLISKVNQAGVKITTSSTQIAASGRQLEATVNEQVASTNEVVATAKEIAATSTELVRVMDDVSSMSEGTTISASNGQKELVRMEHTMRQLAEATSSISAKLGVISEKANNISSIVTTITKVADQTNLLSLNAAIEAEKAGEYGLGFAVVAREIRRLADQTAVATLDIESMVKEMQSAVATGVMEMDKFTKEVGQGVEDIRGISVQLAEIIDRVQALTPRFESVSQGMDAQSIGARQISEAMVQLSEAANQTADALREINRAIEQLNEAGHDLRQEIARFQL